MVNIVMWFVSSPGPKVYVRNCHHFASIQRNINTMYLLPKLCKYPFKFHFISNWSNILTTKMSVLTNAVKTFLLSIYAIRL